MTDNFSTSSQVSPELKDQELEFLNSTLTLPAIISLLRSSRSSIKAYR